MVQNFNYRHNVPTLASELLTGAWTTEELEGVLNNFKMHWYERGCADQHSWFMARTKIGRKLFSMRRHNAFLAELARLEDEIFIEPGLAENQKPKQKRPRIGEIKDSQNDLDYNQNS